MRRGCQVHHRRLSVDDCSIGAPNAPLSHHRFPRRISLCDRCTLSSPTAQETSVWRRLCDWVQPASSSSRLAPLDSFESRESLEPPEHPCAGPCRDPVVGAGSLPAPGPYAPTRGRSPPPSTVPHPAPLPAVKHRSAPLPTAEHLSSPNIAPHRTTLRTAHRSAPLPTAEHLSSPNIAPHRTPLRAAHRSPPTLPHPSTAST